MTKLCIQVGHQNIQYNTDAALHGSTGAPQEMEKNYKIVSRLCEILRGKGFEVKQTDANANSDPAVTDTDWDLFLACHCDADSSLLSGGFVDYAAPSIDSATNESQRICQAIRSEYFEHSGIVERPERMQQSPGVMYYYMWKYLSAKTPCVLVEMGESIDPHDNVILNDPEIVASALARGICKAFNVSYDPIVNPGTQPNVPTNPPINQDALLNQYKEALLGIKKVVYGRTFFFYKKEFAAISDWLTKAGI